MKKLFVCIAALLLAGTAFAASPSLWYGEEGTVTEYVTKDAKEKITGYTEMIVSSVVDMGFQTRVEVEVFSYDKNKKKQNEEAMVLVYTISNDNMIFDLGSLFQSTDEVSFTFRGDDIAYPLNLEVGDKLPLYEATVYADFQDPSTGIWYNDFEVLTMTASKREVSAMESVETEVGTFECYKIDEVITQGSQMAGEETSYQSTWYADGVGQVKSVKYDRKGNVTSTETLVSISK